MIYICNLVSFIIIISCQNGWRDDEAIPNDKAKAWTLKAKAKVWTLEAETKTQNSVLEGP